MNRQQTFDFELVVVAAVRKLTAAVVHSAIDGIAKRVGLDGCEGAGQVSTTNKIVPRRRADDRCSIGESFR